MQCSLPAGCVGSAAAHAQSSPDQIDLRAYKIERWDVFPSLESNLIEDTPLCRMQGVEPGRSSHKAHRPRTAAGAHS